MLEIKDQSTLVGMVELRVLMPKLAKNLKNKKVIVVNRGVPIAVLQDYREYEEKEAMLENFEDLVLGNLAKERYEKGTEKDYLAEETVAKKLKIKL